jgi:hypothetical protein
MASLMMGTSVNMNMFSTANAQGIGQYNNQYEQSTYGNDPYGSSSYDTSYSYEQSYDDKSYDKEQYYGPQQPSYDKPKNSYSQSSYSDYSDYKTKDKKYECRTGPFEGFFVSSVEFCDVKDKHDKKDRDRDNRTGTQGPPGPQGPIGPQGPQGIPGVNGTNGINGTNGVNGTNFDPCVACLLDALVKLDSGALLVNVTLEFPRAVELPAGVILPQQLLGLNITLPLVIDVDVALLLQQSLALSLNLTEDATIFEICAAINAQGLDIDAILELLDGELTLAVQAQINLLVNQIIEALEDILRITIPDAIIDLIIGAIDIDAIVADINANVLVSLGILELCLGLDLDLDAATATPTPSTFQLPQMNPTIQQMNPTIQQNSQVLPSGDPMLQLQSTLSPIS